jgi:hypothetical protein
LNILPTLIIERSSSSSSKRRREELLLEQKKSNERNLRAHARPIIEEEVSSFDPDVVKLECQKELEKYHSCKNDPYYVAQAQKNFINNFITPLREHKQDLLLSRLKHLDETFEKLPSCDNPLELDTFNQYVLGSISGPHSASEFTYYDIPPSEYWNHMEGKQKWCFGKQDWITSVLDRFFSNSRNFGHIPSDIFTEWKNFDPIKDQKWREGLLKRFSSGGSEPDDELYNYYIDSIPRYGTFSGLQEAGPGEVTAPTYPVSPEELRDFVTENKSKKLDETQWNALILLMHATLKKMSTFQEIKMQDFDDVRKILPAEVIQTLAFQYLAALYKELTLYYTLAHKEEIEKAKKDEKKFSAEDSQLDTQFATDLEGEAAKATVAQIKDFLTSFPLDKFVDRRNDFDNSHSAEFKLLPASFQKRLSDLGKKWLETKKGLTKARSTRNRLCSSDDVEATVKAMYRGVAAAFLRVMFAMPLEEQRKDDLAKPYIPLCSTYQR